MSKPTNYTPIDAVKVLCKELEKLFEGKTFSGQGGNKQLKFLSSSSRKITVTTRTWTHWPPLPHSCL